MTMLSVVVIGRNEGATIARLLDSVLRESGRLPAEVVVVDSASTDGMAEIAAGYPVAVLRLLPGQPLSAAAGRYVGFGWSTGSHVLFLDGDMELYPGWLDRGMRVLAERPDTAVVTGTLVERPQVGGSAAPPVAGDDAEVTEVAFAAGAGLYRREILERVGCFNPFLRSDEEPELCLRIRRAGYRVLQTSYPIAYHYSPAHGSIATVVGRWRRGLFLGAGQNLRLLFGTPLFWPYLRERGFGIAPGLAALTGLACAGVSVTTGRSRWFNGWLASVGAVLTADVARRHGDVRGTAHALMQRALIVDGTVRGLLMAPDPPGSYPSRVEVVRAGATRERGAGLDTGAPRS